MPRLPNFYYDQMSGPHGRLANAAARWMNLGNRVINKQAVRRLDAQPSEVAVDVGFGGGLGLGLLLETGALVIGIDPSHAMARFCGDQFAAALDGGQLALCTGLVEELPFRNGSVDRILAVNTIYFWEDQARGIRELRRVLRPEGRLVIATSSPRTCRFFGFGAKGMFVPEPDVIVRMAQDAGFATVDVDRVPNLGGTLLFVCGSS
jgi:ubiquinone/menaquinone biosynthesis C-methylase UbiE